MKTTCIYIYAYPMSPTSMSGSCRIAMLKDSGRSWVITCHSWEIGKILLLLLSYYYHIEYIYIYIRMIIGDRAEWYFGSELGQAFERGSDCTCSACVDWGPSVAVNGSQVTDLLSWAHTYLWEREGLLRSCHGFLLFLNWLIGGGDGGGLSTTLSPGLRSGGLESKFGQGPGPRDRSGMG